MRLQKGSLAQKEQMQDELSDTDTDTYSRFAQSPEAQRGRKVRVW